jgi:predicted nuclease of predicted toxin-antitoxin system
VIRLLCDENFNGKIVRAVRSLDASIAIARVQDMGLSGAADPVVLEFAAAQHRLLLTHDGHTMPAFALERVKVGLPMPGLVVVHEPVALRQVAEDLVLIALAGHDDEYEGRVVYLPFR